MNYRTVAKAVNGAAIAFVGALSTALTTGHILWYQWVSAGGAAVIAFSGIYATQPPKVDVSK